MVSIGTGSSGDTQENVVVGHTGAVFPLEFEDPKIPEGGAEEAAENLKEGVQVLLYYCPVMGVLIVVRKHELRLHDVSTIAAQMPEAAAGLAGELPNVGP